MSDDKRLDDHIIEDRIAFTRIESTLDKLGAKLDQFKDQVSSRLLMGLGALVMLFLGKVLDIALTIHGAK